MIFRWIQSTILQGRYVRDGSCPSRKWPAFSLRMNFTNEAMAMGMSLFTTAPCRLGHSILSRTKLKRTQSVWMLPYSHFSPWRCGLIQSRIIPNELYSTIFLWLIHLIKHLDSRIGRPPWWWRSTNGKKNTSLSVIHTTPHSQKLNSWSSNARVLPRYT